MRARLDFTHPFRSIVWNASKPAFREMPSCLCLLTEAHFSQRCFNAVTANKAPSPRLSQYLQLEDSALKDAPNFRIGQERGPNGPLPKKSHAQISARAILVSHGGSRRGAAPHRSPEGPRGKRKGRSAALRYRTPPRPRTSAGARRRAAATAAAAPAAGRPRRRTWRQRQPPNNPRRARPLIYMGPPPPRGMPGTALRDGGPQGRSRLLPSPPLPSLLPPSGAAGAAGPRAPTGGRRQRPPGRPHRRPPPENGREPARRGGFHGDPHHSPPRLCSLSPGFLPLSF